MTQISLDKMSETLQQFLTQEQADVLLGLAIKGAGLEIKDDYSFEESHLLRKELAELGEQLCALLDKTEA